MPREGGKKELVPNSDCAGGSVPLIKRIVINLGDYVEHQNFIREDRDVLIYTYYLETVEAGARKDLKNSFCLV